LIRDEVFLQGCCGCGERRRVAGDTYAINRLDSVGMEGDAAAAAAGVAAAVVAGAGAGGAVCPPARRHDADALDASSLHILGAAAHAC
jgi:hypothetical protein